jgi:hypothetical protein
MAQPIIDHFSSTQLTKSTDQQPNREKNGGKLARVKIESHETNVS